jgi:hypothetical protein
VSVSKTGLREPGEHTSGPNLASRDNVAHNPTLYTILQTSPPVYPALSKAGPDDAVANANRIPINILAVGARLPTTTAPLLLARLIVGIRCKTSRAVIVLG